MDFCGSGREVNVGFISLVALRGAPWAIDGDDAAPVWGRRLCPVQDSARVIG